MINRNHFLLFSFLSFFISSICSAIPEKPLGYVSDFSHRLDENAQAKLTAICVDLNEKTTDEIAVVTVDSLEGMTVEDYASQLFKKWGIGKKGKDNGVLILVCPTERKIRIEVGYGLEGILPDGLAGQIIRENFKPAFKTGDYSAGILSGVKRIVGVLQEEPGVVASQSGEQGDWFDKHFYLFMGLFFSIFIFIGCWFLANGIVNKVGPSVLFGLGFAGIPLIMAIAFAQGGTWYTSGSSGNHSYDLPPSPGLIFYCFALAIFVFVWGWRSSWKQLKHGIRPAKWSQGDWHDSSSGGFSSGGFGGGGGGGSFGGGSSGGGGASGGW